VDNMIILGIHRFKIGWDDTLGLIDG
jgi:hypothetical protein